MNDREIKRRLAKLEALERGGVDNWEFYGESLKDWVKENHIDECIDWAVEEINNLLTEATVEEPAGTGCGYAIHHDEDKMHSILFKLIKDSQKD